MLKSDDRITTFLAKQTLAIRRARKSFWAYSQLMAPSFYQKDREYLKTFCKELQEFYFGDDEVLIVNLPPRHGKSRTVGLFAQWLFGVDNQLKIMTGSYNETLSTTFSKTVRNTIAEEKAEITKIVYSDIFPDTKIKRGDAAANLWGLEGGHYNYLATSPTGTATGFGCFVGETKVLTSKGEMTIEELYNDKTCNRVLSYNTNCDKIRYNQIMAKRRLLSNEIVKVRTSNGREITCTSDHRFYTNEKGWVRADKLRTGNTIVTADYRTNLRKVRKGIHTQKVRGEESYKKRLPSHLLFQRVCLRNNQRKSIAGEMQGLRKTNKRKTKVLFKGMQKQTNFKKYGRHRMPDMRGNIQTEVAQDSVLLDEMQKQSTFKENAGRWKLALQKGHKLYERIPGYKAIRERKRRIQMSDMWVCRRADAEQEIWHNNQFEGTPQGREYKKQHNGKLGYFMPRMSYKVAQDEKIISVENVEGSRFVYDIQVDKDENFFANGVLVHNCDIMIVDDVIKNAEEAYNENVLDKHWDWFTNTMLSRIEEGGKIIIVMTRWASKDLAGRALNHFQEEGKKVKHITMKALQDNGEMLCDEVLSRKSYESKVRAMGVDIASANYQQEPMDVKGRLYTTFKTYDSLPTNCKQTIAYTDTADLGSDFYCSVAAEERDGDLFVKDVIYTKEGMEITEPLQADMLVKNNVNVGHFESNNGGRGVARNVERLIKERHNTRRVSIRWFHQNKNKQARILSMSTYVMDHVYFPSDWKTRWPDFYKAMNEYQKEGKNKHDDAPDAVTGLCEVITKPKAGISSARGF